MKECPTVSIILSNFNCGAYIGKTLSSLIAQTYTDWEAEIVDDGSTDNSRDIISQYAKKDPRIKPHFLIKNQGMCSGFNTALEHATGKYFARIDSDDFWEPEKLSLQVEYMDKHPKCGVCFTWVRVIDESENTVPSYLCEERDKVYNSNNRSQAQWLRTFFFCGCKVCHPSALIRREAIEKVGVYNYIYKQIQDYDLWIRIVKNYDIYVITKKLVNYRWFLNERSNASAHNKDVATRGLLEAFLVFMKFNDGVSDELFYEAFHEDFLYKNAKSHDEIRCERALIMYYKSYLGNTGRIIGLQMLDALFNDLSTKCILENKYNITTKTYAEMTTQPVFYDSACFGASMNTGLIDSISSKELIKKKLSTHKMLYHTLKFFYQPLKWFKRILLRN